LCDRLGLSISITLTRHPLSRSYGVILPSSLTRVFPRALGFSPRLPVSVWGTGALHLARGFSRQYEIGHFGTQFPRRHPSGCMRSRICLGPPPRKACTGTTNGPLRLPSCVT